MSEVQAVGWVLMSGVIGFFGAVLLFVTSVATVLMLAMETCENGTADYFYRAMVNVGYLNLIAFFLMWIGYKERNKWTIGLVAAGILSMSWVMVRGFLVFHQVNLNGFAPCYGYYLEDGDYGSLVYYYGPYFGFFYLIIICILMYTYIIKLDAPLRRKTFAKKRSVKSRL